MFTYLQRLRGSTYFSPLSSTNVGMYIAPGKRCYLIDSGSNDEDAEVILNAITKKGWILEAILNTHAHLDNFGGDAFLYKKLDPPPKIYATRNDAQIIENPRYLQSVSYVNIKGPGAIQPLKKQEPVEEEEDDDEYDEDYDEEEADDEAEYDDDDSEDEDDDEAQDGEDIWADYEDDDEEEDDDEKPKKKPELKQLPKPEPKKAESSSMIITPKGCPVRNYLVPNQPLNIPGTKEKFQILDLSGHTAGQVGIVTPDGICFIGDSLLTTEEIGNNPIPSYVDISKTKISLDTLCKAPYSTFVPTHGRILEFDISTEVFLNKQQLNMVEEAILMHLQMPRTTDELVALIFASFELEENVTNFYSINTTVKAFMEYLRKSSKVKVIYEKGQSRWFAI